MGILWTFGDSFTFGHGCRPDAPTNEYYYNYKSESDDVWPNLLGQKLNVEVKNLGKCGVSNDFIIDSIIDNFDMIKPNDVVIIGKSFYQRFDVPKLNNNTFDTETVLGIKVTKLFCPGEPAVVPAAPETVPPNPPLPPIPGSI